MVNFAVFLLLQIFNISLFSLKYKPIKAYNLVAEKYEFIHKRREPFYMSIELVNLLIQYEKTIARFYSVCAKKFPEEVKFWSKLSKEEEKHALILEKVNEKVDNSNIFLNDTRLKIQPLRKSIEYAEEVTLKVERGELNLLSALSIADAIETSIIESAYYKIFEGKSIKFSNFLEQVQNESVAHRSKVREKLIRVRRESNLS